MWRTKLPDCCRKPSAGPPEPSAEGRGDAAPTKRLRIGQRCALLLISCYQVALSPLLFTRCKFHPTCSRYTYEAIEVYGVLRGSWLGAKRLLRCRPFAPGGFDPVPERLGRPDA